MGRRRHSVSKKKSKKLFKKTAKRTHKKNIKRVSANVMRGGFRI